MSSWASGIAHPPAPGARLLIRDQEWVVLSTDRTYWYDHLIDVTGLSPLARDVQWQFIQNWEKAIKDVLIYIGVACVYYGIQT